MSVHYKFKSALEYDTVTFDGLHISVRDLKNAIMQQKRIGKNTDFDLQVTNAQTKEIYDSDEALIPKNTSLLIARIPSAQTKPKTWEGYGGNSSPVPKIDDGGPISKAMDLSSLDASEEDKIKAMMSQSTQDYDPSNYLKIRGANQMGAVPSNYRCFKCHQGGHWIKDCPLSQGSESIEIKKSTGIPRSFMVPVEGPQVPGAMMTPNGHFAVPVLDHKAYTEKPQPAPPEEKRPEIPDDLLCSLCSDLLTDAVMIPCCGDSYCDECIRSCLLESEEHECPACHERDISPGTLIPNRYLRNSVANFKSTTGYVKRLVYKPPPTPTKEPEVEIDMTKEITSTENIDESPPSPTVKSEINEKTIIREADSTEPQKNTTNNIPKEDFTEDIDLKEISKKTSPVPEGPPGVSPRPEGSPRAQRITNITIGRTGNNRGHSKINSNERSPRRPHHVQRSPTYQDTMSRGEDRPGTPTVDEPGVGGPTTMCSTTVYHSAPTHFNTGPPPNVMNPIMGMPPPNMQGPPPLMQGSFPGQPITASYPPPNQGPPPNFRLPPPGGPPYIASSYNVPPRPVYDCVRPPPPSYPMYPSGSRSSRGRDYSRDIPRRGRTPPRIIDDPLEAFNRMLREKDERERRAKQRKPRSYSRSSSRSFSPSPRRLRSRSPRRRSRSRSRSFSISRSRSRSFSPSPRTSPPRQFSPKRSPHRGPHRFRSPIRSPPRYRFKEQQISDRERVRDRDLDRDRDRDKEFRDRDNSSYTRDRERDFRERDHRDREFGYGGYERDRQRGRQQWSSQSLPRKDYPGADSYYHPQEMATQPPPFVPPNRYPPREAYPQHHMPPIQHPPAQHLPPIRRYDDVAPPGTEQPPIPGLENTPRFDERYSYDHNNREIPPNDKFSPTRSSRDIEKIEKHDHRDDMNLERDRDRKHERSPDRNRYSSPKRTSKEREHRDRPSSPDKHKRRRRDDSVDREKRDYDRSHDRKRELSDDERAKKNKEKKRKKEKREKKEEEKKKRKEKKEKREQDKQKKAEEKEKSEKKSRVDSKRVEPEDQDVNNDYENTDDKNSRYSDSAKASNNYEQKKYDNDENTTVYDNSDAADPDKDDTSDDRDKPKKVYDVKPDLAAEERKSDSFSESKPTQKAEISPKLEENHDLYGDLLSEGIDNSVIENYGKIKELRDEPPSKSEKIAERSPKQSSRDEGELSYEDDSEKDILELHTNETDLKTDLDVKSEVLAPVPERSKWEVEEDATTNGNSAQNRGDSKLDRLEKSGKVTNEVLKRAENAIFAKAINAIRPIEIKKISLDRAKLYSGERDRDKKSDDIRDDVRNIQVTIPGANNFDDDVVPVEAVDVSKPRLSVKERLGCKVDDLDRIVKIDKPYDRNRSRSLSPLSRRAGELSRNLSQGERRIEVDDRKRIDSKVAHGDKGRDRHHRQFRSDREPRRDTFRRENRDVKRDFRRDRERERDYRKEDRRTDRKDIARSRSRGRGTERSREDDKRSRDKRKFSKSPSSSHEKDKRKRKDKKEKKKEKTKKHRKDDDDKESNKGSKNESDEKTVKLKSTTDKRKATLDEASFEPDYDLESESEKEDGGKKDKEEKVKKRSVSHSAEDDTVKKKVKVEEKKYESSSSYSSESSSDEDRKKKKHRKHKKKKSKKDSSSSSESESESESSEDEKDKKKKKHKKKLKKKRKSKHK